MTVGEICNRQVVIIRKDETLLEAARLMRDHHVGSLVVVDEEGEKRIPVGILTDRDIVVGVVAKGLDYFRRLSAGDVMSSNLILCEEAESILEALERMRSHGVRRLPIVNKDGDLEGILTSDDVLCLISKEISDMATLVCRQQDRERDERT
jgi:CBS domain-containing protein